MTAAMDGSVPRKLPRMVAAPNSAVSRAKACRPYTTCTISRRLSRSMAGPGPRGRRAWLIVCSPSESEVFPHGVDARLHCVVHDDGRTPLAAGLAGPLGGGVEAHLAAQASHRAGEVEVVDGGVVDQRGVACGVDAGSHGP